jgi:hypothetical protein
MVVSTIPPASEIASLSAEHASLAKQQYESLQKSPYIRMSASEAAAYDERRLRIGEICDLLAKFRSKGGGVNEMGI